MKFYQLPNSNLFTHRLLFFSREATSETYDPRVFFLILFAFAIHLFLAFIFRSTKPKIQKYFAALYFICDLFIQSIIIFLPSRTNFWRRYPKGIDNPFNTSGCEVLLFECRGCLCCVDWFPYWFDNLGFITEGNTYRRCAASSLPLRGNTNVVPAAIRVQLFFVYYLVLSLSLPLLSIPPRKLLDLC